MRLFHKKRHKVAKRITNRKIFTQKKRFIATKKIVAIILESLQ